ncbi:DMT family transporter [Lysobacter yananisis]|uniref:DMT family transporter n=1 Tax=Lysobacter yananisis TaxID=1003114 RepID=A0ABY9PD47_9GAMM|nr:DMT family transporter [Lysobacter yananisis]WMT05003.1 DMT family transporter [Lysobacter yananisis]
MITATRAGAPLAAIALALAAGTLWGSLGLITRALLGYGLGAAQLALLRLGGAFAITLLAALAMRRVRALSLRQWAWLAAIGAVCQALGSVSFSAAVDGAGSSLAIVLLCMGPLFTAAINRLCFGERLDGAAWRLVLLALSGLALSVLCGRGEPAAAGLFAAPWYVGVAWGLLSGLCYGLFPIFARALGPLDTWVVVSFSLGLGAACLASLHGAAPAAWPALSDVPAWLWIAALILIPTVFADVLYVRAIALGGPMLATVFALVEVPAAALYARWWLGAPIVPAQWFGIALFCSGLAGLAWRRGTAAAAPAAAADLPAVQPETPS